jgi:AraC-like DNA-binding protein
MIIKLLLLWNCGLLFLLIIGQCFVPNKTCKNFTLSLLAITCGVWIFNTALYYFGLHNQLPHLNKIHIPFLCLSGTSWYLYVKCFLGRHIFEAKDFAHLLPAIICVLLGLPFYFESAEFKLSYIETSLDSLSVILMYIASRISEINSFVYLILTLLLVYRQLTSINNSSQKKTYRIILYITIIAMFSLALRTLGAVSNIQFISIIIPSIIILFLFTVLYSLSYYNPSVLGISELKKTRGKSKENHLFNNVKEQMAVFKEIIERDKVYLNSNITLAELASQLNTQPYILSEVINASMNINFKTFINGLRIEHAARLLIQEKKTSILEITYASGFNSKSVFYKHFFEAKSMTPVQYRKMCLEKKTCMDIH